MELKELVQMSNRYGANPEYVLAGGGNTSVKDEDSLYVKCSGTQLENITEQGFVAMDRKMLISLMEKEYPAEDQAREAAFLADVMEARTDADKTKRPSVEALLHSLFPQKYVLHVHPAMINGLTCSVGGKEKAAALLGEEVIWIPICRPGYILGKLCWDAMKAYKEKTGKEIQVVLLQNHGIFVAGDTVEEIDRLFAGVWDTLEKMVEHRPDLSPCEETEKAKEAAELLAKETGKTVRFVDVKEGMRFTKTREACGPLEKPFTPDHIVYCGPFPLVLRKPEDVKQELAAFTERTGLVPKVVLAVGTGAFVMGENEGECGKAEMLLRDAMKVAVYAENFGGPLAMTEDLTDFIIHWEAEAYRKKQ